MSVCRIDQDELNFSAAETIAWEIALPYMYLPILCRDRDEVETLSQKLEKIFSKQALSAAAKRIKER